MGILFFNPKLENYLFTLEKPTISKIIRLLDMLKIFGEKLGMPYSRQISGNFYELRVRGRQEIRIFYCFHRDQAVIIHAFVKKSFKTPQRELETALSRIKLLTSL